MPRPASSIAWLSAYLILMALLVSGLTLARNRVVSNLSTPDAIEEWRRWADETRHPPAPDQPVERRPVKSDEPPALILMRDHFPAILAVAVVVGSFLFAFLGFIGAGLVRQRRTAHHTPVRRAD